MDDDKKLMIIFYFLVGLAIVAVIGLWEYFVQPLFVFITNHISFGR